MVTAVWTVRDKRFNCGAVLTVIKIYRYIIYAKNFVNFNCRAGTMVTIRSFKYGSLCMIDITHIK